MDTVKIVANAKIAKIFSDDRNVHLAVLNRLSYTVPGFEQTNAYKNSGWDGRSSFYSMRKHTFPAGFLSMVASFLRAEGLKVFTRRQAPSHVSPITDCRAMPPVDDYPVLEKYDYQFEAVNQLLKHKRIIAQIATGGGKSRIAKLATMAINRPTLFLTTRRVLYYQMAEHFKDAIKYRNLTERVGFLGDGDWSPSNFINVGMVKTLAMKLNDPKQRRQTIETLHKFEFLILEEAHETSNDQYYVVANACANAHYRLALTATPFMKEHMKDNMSLMGTVGPVGIKVSEKQLIDSGILATPYFKYAEPERPERLYKTTKWPSCYKIGVVESYPRNKIIIQEAAKARKHGLRVLILVIRKNQGALLEKTLFANKIKAKFIWGESNKIKRKKALDDLESGKLEVLIGTNILDVGVDVPSVGMVIIAGGMKGEEALRQRIGRGMRGKKKNNYLFVLDFMDKHNRKLLQHSMTRKQIVASTPGFSSNILAPYEDFDYGLIK